MSENQRVHGRRDIIITALLVGLALATLVIVWTRVRLEETPEQAADAVTVSPDTEWDPNWPALPTVASWVGRSPELARAAYAFAERRGDILQDIPCYCGCEGMGHGNNRDCYVKGRTADGKPIWDGHAFT